MTQDIFSDAQSIISAAIQAAQPDQAVERALSGHSFGTGRVVIIAIGKAAWQMAKAACTLLGPKVSEGIVITKYGHTMGEIPGITIFESGHPVPDENSVKAAEAAIQMAQNLGSEDQVLFLVSGGGSALFEKPLVSLAELQEITKSLLACGADITEINTIRKRLSAVKGGRFAEICAPAEVFSIVLSDILGDPLDMIASGPAYPDDSTSAQALEIIERYGIELPPETKRLLCLETPRKLQNVTTEITGSVSVLCKAAEEKCRELGYRPCVLTASLSCTARDAGSFLASIAQYHSSSTESIAFIAGGETVVKLTGSGIGGRNQEIALSAAEGIDGLKDTAVFSVGSDGTDGPTDAAGGFVDGGTVSRLRDKEVQIRTCLQQNDSYHALEAVGGLVKTGPTGTNVNDISVLLIRRV